MTFKMLDGVTVTDPDHHRCGQVGTIVLVHIRQANGSWKSDEDYDAVYNENHHFMVEFCDEDGKTLDMPVLAGAQLKERT
jgi:hypothetical protein